MAMATAAQARGGVPARLFDGSRGRFLLIGLCFWLATALILLAMRWRAILQHDFIDVDDQLRLAEVNDWLAGQSFYDVTQYRMNQPWGAPMHWSRLVDMPIALIVVLLRPLIGTATAETIAAVAVPLFVLGGILMAIGLIGRRLGGDRVGIASMMLSAMCLPCLDQVSPLRVDHHGWETCCSLIGLLGALGARGRRSGIIAGVALAVAMQISLEQLPFAAILGGAFAIRWLVAPGTQARHALGWYVGTLAIAEAALFATLHRPASWPIGYCDAVSPPQLILFAAAALGVIVLTLLDPRKTAAKLAGLASAGVVALLAFHAYPPHCGLNAFDALEPIARQLWYDRVLEGLPVWRQTPVLAAGAVGTPLVALIGGFWLWRRAGYAVRWPWLVYAVALLGTAAVAALVNRVGGLASVIAAPAVAMLVVPLVTRCQQSASAVVRVLGTCAVVLLLSPLAPVAIASTFEPVTREAVKMAAKRPCGSTEFIRELGVLPASRLLTPLDITPAILLETRHAPLASGHHRNHVAMTQVITAFTSDADTAHAIIRRRGLRYVLICPNASETHLYQDYAPNGFASRLAHGARIDWLAPVPLPGVPIKVWRVLN